MAQSLRQIKARIRSIDSTKKLTRAMEMISAVKLKRSSKMFDISEIYFSKIEALLSGILPEGMAWINPFLENRAGKHKIGFCVITSDTGLCGNYNYNIIRTVENFLSKYPQDKILLSVLGRKGFSYFKKRGFAIAHSYAGFNGRYSDDLCAKLLKGLTDMFLRDEADEVYFAYVHSGNAYNNKPVVEKLLNIDFFKKGKIEYIFEPGIERVLEELIPVYLFNKVKRIILSAFTAEHRARAVSMGEATKNAIDLLEGLVLSRNKIRQSSITGEIMEVISSAEALKG